jgi:hypothetical protein
MTIALKRRDNGTQIFEESSIWVLSVSFEVVG